MKRHKVVAFSLTQKHHDIVKRAAKKLKIKNSEVIKYRIRPTWEEMVTALKEDMKHSDVIDLNRV